VTWRKCTARIPEMKGPIGDSDGALIGCRSIHVERQENNSSWSDDEDGRRNSQEDQFQVMLEHREPPEVEYTFFHDSTPATTPHLNHLPLDDSMQYYNSTLLNSQ